VRQVVLDTETTGLEPEQGHRIIEIGCVELLNRRPSGRSYHQYINPQRNLDPGAVDVHGLTADFLADKPIFSEIVEDFVEFASGAELVIHNAPFDIGFINHEFKMLQPPREGIESLCTVLDSLVLARKQHPGQRNSLDALCKRYAVDNSRRELHGALLDAQLLAEVYLAITGGQATLSLGNKKNRSGRRRDGARPVDRSSGVELRVVQASESELEAHYACLDAVDKAGGGDCVWRQLEPAAQEERN
jgi:DNA polymerase III subunit epsilon